MPKSALSLLGYLEQQKAFEYLQKQCLLDDSSPQVLQQHFEDAVLQLGSAIERAGYPEMLGIPALHQHYVNTVRNSPLAKALEGRGTITIQLIEIAPLLAFQVHVELDRAKSLYQPSKTVPDVGEMLLKCFPLQGNENIPVELSQPLSPNSWMVRTPSLNLRPLEGGILVANGEHYLGVKVGLANQLVQVLKFQGKAYLINGFHRAFSLGKAGAKYLPCIVQEVQSLNEIANLGIALERLQSDNPPTMGHFLNDRAYPVQLRNYKKHMTVTYTEHLFFEE